MPVFDDIPNLSDFQLMDMMRKTDETTLAIALLGASEEIRKRIAGILTESQANRVNERMKQNTQLSDRDLIILSQQALISAILNAPRAGGQVTGKISGI